MSRVQAYTEVYLGEFPDEDILAEADAIMRRRGLGLDGPEAPSEIMCNRFSDLAAAIARGNADEALRILDVLAGDDQRYRDAIDLGARRGRQ